VKVSTPSGGTREVRVNQQAPGEYSGSFDATELGSYIVTVAEKDPNGGERVSSTGFSLPYPPEYRSMRPNHSLLARMAERTRGKEVADAAETLRNVLNPGESITELWPLFILLAALVLPFDVGVRRIALPLRDILAKLWSRIRMAREKPSAQPEVVGRLQQAKQRAQRSGSTEPPQVVIHERREAEAERPKVAAATPARPGVASSKLLEAKRKRKEGE
jgi:hypothetical protein